jgi:hypothetical protein
MTLRSVGTACVFNHRPTASKDKDGLRLGRWVRQGALEVNYPDNVRVAFAGAAFRAILGGGGR